MKRICDVRLALLKSLFRISLCPVWGIHYSMVDVFPLSAAVIADIAPAGAATPATVATSIGHGTRVPVMAFQECLTMISLSTNPHWGDKSAQVV
jgi:hypothetical protein